MGVGGVSAGQDQRLGDSRGHLPPLGSVGRPPPRARYWAPAPAPFPLLSTPTAPQPSSLPSLFSGRALSAYLVVSLGPRGLYVSNRCVSVLLALSFSVLCVSLCLSAYLCLSISLCLTRAQFCLCCPSLVRPPVLPSRRPSGGPKWLR